MQDVQITAIQPEILNGAIDLSVTQTGGSGYNRTLHMTYGDWSLPAGGGANVKRSQVDADIDVSISNQRNAGNGAVTFTVTTRYYNFHRTLINDQPVVMNYTIHIYASQERADERFSQSGQMQSSATYSDVSFSYDVTVPALGTVHVGIGRYWNDIGNSDVDDEFRGGLTVYNPNPPDYRPGQRLISGTWQSHNRSGGRCHRLVGGTWTEMRTENGGTGTGNPPLRRSNNTWYNQRKVGQE